MGASVLIADRYRLDEPLARGGMGSVWRGLDMTLHRPVAVKLLAVEGDADLTERFHLEARAAARLNHPNLVAVYDFGDHDGRPYLVMELVEGRSLAEELAARGPLEPGWAADVALQTARGLAVAHQQAVVHRDIKPGNLMLATDGTVKIADFGIARLIDEVSPALTATGRVMGSSAYLAPERALGSPAQPASDVYSLGCVLYEMLTGQPPFRGNTAAAVAHLHVRADPSPPELLRPDLPVSLTDLLPRTLAKTPEARPTASQTAEWLGAPGNQSQSASTTKPRRQAAFLQVPLTGSGAGSTVVLPTLSPSPVDLPGGPGSGRRPPGSKIRMAAAGALAFTAAVLAATIAGSDHHHPASTPPHSSAPAPTTAQPSLTPTAGPAVQGSHHGHSKKHDGKNKGDQ